MAHLPENPDLEQLRRRARELQRTRRHTDRDYALTSAQRDLAREYGFASWPRLVRHVRTVAARKWTLERDRGTHPADTFLDLGCLTYQRDETGNARRAQEMLRSQPTLRTANAATAAVTADVSALREMLTRNPSAAREPVGPFAWAPLMYLAYGRLDTDLEDCLDTARLLLAAGADVNDGRFFAGLPTPFTVLTGVCGGGERDQPPHPHVLDLARLLLESGAQANDGQAVYNRMFGTDDSVYALLLEHGLGRGAGGPWRAALPDVLPAPRDIVGGLLAWAVTHDQRDRVELLASHGVDVTAPLPDGRLPIDVAVGNGHAALAHRLTVLGAAMPTLSPGEAFVAAVLAGDAATVAATPLAVVTAVRTARPALMVWAAAHGRVAAVELLSDNGFDIDAMGRSDIAIDQPWQTALHTAVERDDAAMVARLIELGADPTIRDARFDSTPVQWARHLGHDDLVDLFDA
ncbi:ankyrin repeat domain-containing protein [Williamsia sp. M5A3_1d]